MESFLTFWIHGWMPVQLLAVLVFTFLIFVITNHYLKGIGKGVSPFWQAVLVWLIAFWIFKYLIFPPLPSSILIQYMALVTIVIFLLISTTEASWKAFKRPITAVLVAETPKHKIVRAVFFMAVPVLISIATYHLTSDIAVQKQEEPIELRVYHSAPPQSIIVHGQPFILQTEQNPFRVDDQGNYTETIQQQYINGNPWDPNPPLFLQYVREGGEIFFRNCHFCHGANLDARGMFAFAFNPIPVNLTDPGAIAQLQESYVFWRVAKGGPGLSRDAFPWASAMPPWEQHLTTEEIWKVILFEYWHTGYDPNTWD